MSNPGDNGFRLCFGAVGSGGNINRAGSGDWTVIHVSTGLYAVTFNTPFTELPCVSLDGDLGSTSSFNIFLDTATPITVDGFTVRIIKSSALADFPFDFIAAGIG